MRYINYIALAALLWISPVNGEDMIAIADDGSFRIDSIRGGLLFFGKNWNGRREQSTSTVKAGSPARRADGGFALKGEFLTENRCFDFVQTVNLAAPGRWQLSYELSADPAIESQLLALSLKIPAKTYAKRSITVDDVSLELPEIAAKEVLYSKRDTRQIVLDTVSGTLIISALANDTMEVKLQDDRIYPGNSAYDLRIGLAPSSGGISRAGLKLDIIFTPRQLTVFEITGDKPVSIALDAAKIKPFVLPSDQFKRPGKQSFTIDADAVYLFHTAMQTDIADGEALAELTLQLADGSSRTQSICYGRDVTFYDDLRELPDGQVLLAKDQTAAALRGASLSKIAFDKTKIKKITLNSRHDAYRIAAIAAGDNFAVTPDSDYWIMPGPDRVPVDFKVSVKPGSILDFSDLADAPAGKYGRTVIRNGHFEFTGKPGMPQKFYGANICFNVNYQSKENLKKTVEELVRMGYNTLRIHHYDRDLTDPAADNSFTFNPANIDKLDYLFYQAKEHGLYIAIDLYTLRPTKTGEIKSIGGRELRLQEYKMFAIENDEVFENWKHFAAALLTHVNPYTKMMWKDDPALINICLSNENNLNGHWNTTPATRSLFETVFQSEGGGTLQNFNVFLMKRQIRFYQKAAGFVRSLGCEVPLTDMNMHHLLALGLVRDHYDYVDNHIYHDHPKYIGGPGKFPNEFKNTSSVRLNAEVPRLLMPTRIFGKPFAVSEYNFCAPNRYRAEAGPLMGAYSALQDYDVIQRFAYSHWEAFVHNPSVFGRFDIVTDPVSLLSDRIAVLLFRDGNIRPGIRQIPLIYDWEVMNRPEALIWRKGDAPDAYAELGLVSQIGLVIGGGPAAAQKYPVAVALDPAWQRSQIALDTVLYSPQLQTELIRRNIVSAGNLNAAQKKFRSDTGELMLDSRNGMFQSVTGRSESFVLGSIGELAGKHVRVKAKTAWNVVLVASRDRYDLDQSRRILVIHLTNSNNLKARFTDDSCRTIIDPGIMPHLVDRGEVQIELTHQNAEKLTVNALNMDGTVRQNVAATIVDGKLCFEVNTVSGGRGVLVYEITQK